MAAVNYVIRTTTELKLYTGTSTSSPILATVPIYKDFSTTEHTSGFYKITHGKTGWIVDNGIKIVGEPITSCTVYVALESAKIYASANTSSSVIRTVTNKTEFTTKYIEYYTNDIKFYKLTGGGYLLVSAAGKKTSQATATNVTTEIKTSQTPQESSPSSSSSSSSSTSNNSTAATTTSNNTTRVITNEQTNYLSGLEINEYAATDNALLNKLMTKNLCGIHGMPYQFHPIIDARLPSNDNKTTDATLLFGRKYAEKIVANMPVLFLTPGRPDFMPQYNKNDINTVATELMKGLTGSDIGSNITTMLSHEGRYYTFKFAYKEYYDFVNPMLRICARNLNIHNKTVTIGKQSNTLDKFKWQNAVNPSFKSYISQQEFVPFYIDSQNQITESISNNTTSSKLGSMLDGASDFSNEVQFLLGGYSGKKISAMDQTKYDSVLKDIEGLSDKLLGRSRLFEKIGETLTTVATGGKIFFPEIWQDSDYSKSYNISIKLRTPDCDDLSWYLNICVPIIHLLAMAAPQQMGPNGYASPFLVRGWYKGLFNCDLGIITSLDISKGREGAWTLNGLPTEVDIDITIKDLYSVLTVTNDKKPTKLLRNTALMDYLGNMCGLNVNKPELQRIIDLYLMLYSDKLIRTVTFTDVYNNLMNGITNKLKNMYEGNILGR